MGLSVDEDAESRQGLFDVLRIAIGWGHVVCNQGSGFVVARGRVCAGTARGVGGDQVEHQSISGDRREPGDAAAAVQPLARGPSWIRCGPGGPCSYAAERRRLHPRCGYLLRPIGIPDHPSGRGGARAARDPLASCVLPPARVPALPGPVRVPGRGADLGPGVRTHPRDRHRAQHGPQQPALRRELAHHRCGWRRRRRDDPRPRRARRGRSPSRNSSTCSGRSSSWWPGGGRGSGRRWWWRRAASPWRWRSASVSRCSEPPWSGCTWGPTPAPTSSSPGAAWRCWCSVDSSRASPSRDHPCVPERPRTCPSPAPARVSTDGDDRRLEA